MKSHSYTVGVKLLSGKSFSVKIGPTDTVAAIKQRIFEREGIPPQRQNLLVMGKLLQPDTRDLREYNDLKPGAMVYVTAGVRAGMQEDPRQKDKIYQRTRLTRTPLSSTNEAMRDITAHYTTSAGSHDAFPLPTDEQYFERINDDKSISFRTANMTNTYTPQGTNTPRSVKFELEMTFSAADAAQGLEHLREVERMCYESLDAFNKELLTETGEIKDEKDPSVPFMVSSVNLPNHAEPMYVLVGGLANSKEYYKKDAKDVITAGHATPALQVRTLTKEQWNTLKAAKAKGQKEFNELVKNIAQQANKVSNIPAAPVANNTNQGPAAAKDAKSAPVVHAGSSSASASVANLSFLAHSNKPAQQQEVAPEKPAKPALSH